MQGFGIRLIVIGVLLLAGAGIFFMANQKTDPELQIEQLSIDVRNTQAVYHGGEMERRSAVQIHKQLLQRSYWPAGFGVLFLLMGWATLGHKQETDPSGSPNN